MKGVKPMSPVILGISGSPVPNSNTDRAVRLILDRVGLESEFIKLSDLEIAPCRACLACVETNECVVEDDGRMLAEKFRRAQVFVLGGYTSYSSLDARTKAFMERMHCLRHQQGLSRGKIGVSVITTASPSGRAGIPPAGETAVSQIGFWMMEEGIVNLGALIILGNVPCIRCSHGDQCEMSGIKMIEGPDATVESVGVRSFESDANLLEAAATLARRIRDTLAAPSTI